MNLGIVNLRNSGRLVPPNDGDGNRSGRGNGGDFSTSSSCGELIMGGEEEAHRCVLQHPLQYQRKETSGLSDCFVDDRMPAADGRGGRNVFDGCSKIICWH